MGFKKDDLRTFREKYQLRLALDGREFLAKARFEGDLDVFEGSVLRREFAPIPGATGLVVIALTSAREISRWLDETFAVMQELSDSPDGTIPARSALQLLPRNSTDRFWNRCTVAWLTAQQDNHSATVSAVTAEDLAVLHQELASTKVAMQTLDTRVTAVENDLLSEPSQHDVTAYLDALGLRNEPRT